MNGGTVLSETVIGNPGRTLQPVGIGDFNGDKHNDILLRGEDGTLTNWNLFGGTLTTIGAPGPRTEVQYTGDYNGDGTDDILLRGFDGTITLLQMVGRHAGRGAER